MEHHHFHPDLLQLLIDGIPRLYKSKQAVVDFFHGAGVPRRLLDDLAVKVERDPKSVRKFEIARTVLVRVNDDGDPSLAPRREILKRIIEHEDFSSAWPADVTAAKAFVADVRRLVGAKDAVTRVEDARREERWKRMALLDEAAAARAQRRAQNGSIRDRLFALFGEADAWKRGKLLEKVLNDLFALHRVQVQEAFTVRGKAQEGILEQIDGLIALDGQLYLVEIKWHAPPLGPDLVAPHWVRVARREGARGILISASGFTDAAIEQTRSGLALKTFVLIQLKGLVHVLQEEKCLAEFLRRHVQAAVAALEPHATIDVAKLPGFE